ncbi:MAG: hypothetical protein JNK15_23140 [Planctomycetes bacterium]|nr:hypothetical protein [Planctomycetota bacterium]
MNARRWRAAWPFLLLAACAAPERLPAPPKSHPASPLADAAPERAPSQTLVMPERKPTPNGTGTGRGH